MDKVVNAFFKIRGSSNTSSSQNMPSTYVPEEMDKRVDASMAWSMTVVNEPVWSLGFHFCDEEVQVTPSLLDPPHKHVHRAGDECLFKFRICPLSKFLDFGKWTLWFSYRSKFPEIEGSPRKSTSDLGWGCMHRSAQMLVAQAFSSYLLGSNWKVQVQDATSSNYMELLGGERANVIRKIVKLFSDDQVDMPLSLHNIVQHGVKYGKTPSEWLGPATAGRVLKDIFESEQPVGFAFYVADDSIVDVSAVRKLAHTPIVPEKGHWMIDRLENAKRESIKCGREGKPIKKQKKVCKKEEEKKKEEEESDDEKDEITTKKVEKSPQKDAKVNTEGDDDDDDAVVDDGGKVEEGEEEEEEGSWRPTIVFIPLKLGVTEIDPRYIPSLSAMFKLPQSIGMIGGKPHTSLYFLAAQEDSLHYLDPHRVQETVSTADDGFSLDSWMVPEMRWINCKELDPSLGVGFLILSERDFKDFKSTISKLFGALPPLFSIVDDAQTLVKKSSGVDIPLDDESRNCCDDDGFEVIN